MSIIFKYNIELGHINSLDKLDLQEITILGTNIVFESYRVTSSVKMENWDK